MEKRSQWRRKQRRNNGKRHAWPLDKLFFFFWETLELTWLKEHTFGEPQKKPATGAKKKVTRLFKRPSPSSKTASKKRRRTSKAKQKAQSTLDRKHREMRRKKIIQNCCHFSFTCAHISHIFPLFLFAWRFFFSSLCCRLRKK